ncbi:MAG: DUF4959 domain-containing protein [Tannerella sp.]|jgi:hypothetical protein|nr:DUF4959 domain-containing protein [Tannerella sp.]
MKSLFLTGNSMVIAAMTLLLCIACSEEFTGQFPTDDTPPSPVTVIPGSTVNFPGGATITYQLPDETDLLYVKAVYTLPDGTRQEVKASSFSNSLTVKGFGRGMSTKVQLISVDRSRNESRPAEVEIHPEDSPIYDIFSSIEVNESWGGFLLQWDNPMKEDIVLSVFRKNKDGVFENIENFYSSAATVLQSVRGQDSVRTDFAVSVRDSYNNFTDTLTVSIKPWYETMLDRSRFIAIPKSAKFTVSQYGTSNMNILWDGVVENVPSEGLYYFNTGTYQPYFSINLGVRAKLSRFRYWSRSDYYFRLHSAKEIQLYGTNDPVVGNNPESEDSEWILLNPEVFVSVRPSGLSTSVPATDEDYAYALEGEEWEIPLDAPAVQYVRFKQLSSWTGTMALTCSEIRFWGDPNFQ